MKRLRVCVFLVCLGLGVLTLVVVLSRKHTPPNLAPLRNDVHEHRLPPDVLEAITKMQPDDLAKAGPTPHSFSKRTADFTDEERAKLAKDFAERYKPVVEKWLKAYEGRIPFRLDDLTLDTFHSRFGDYAYTFMVGDITVTLHDSPKLGLKVFYLMTRQGIRQLNQIPGSGFVPDLSVPVTREEVIRMAKADSGVEFKPNEVLIKPTAAACALNGGAFVFVVPAGANPEIATNAKLLLVFDSDGMMVNYNRNPSF